MKIRGQFFAIKQMISELVLAFWIIRVAESNIVDFPFLVFHVDDQWNTRQKLALVSCVSYRGGGVTGKTMEMW